MAELILNNVIVKLSTESSTGTPWTATTKVKSVDLVYECERIDKTKEGSSHRQYAPTIKNWATRIRFNNDFADASVQDKLWTLFGSSGSFITLQESNTDRRWYGPVVIESFPIIAGAVGSLAETEVIFHGNGQLDRDSDPLFFDLDALFFDADQLWF